MTLTAQIITAVVVGLGIYDLVVVLRTGVPTSISRTMQRAGLKSPLVAFVVGYICGHCFGYMQPEPPAVINQTNQEQVSHESH